MMHGTCIKIKKKINFVDDEPSYTQTPHFFYAEIENKLSIPMTICSP
jgi:hypothetical protein